MHCSIPKIRKIANKVVSWNWFISFSVFSCVGFFFKEINYLPCVKSS